MNNNIATKITTVINALNGVEVKGFQNLNNLAGCIHILHEVLEVITLDESSSDTDGVE